MSLRNRYPNAQASNGWVIWFLLFLSIPVCAQPSYLYMTGSPVFAVSSDVEQGYGNLGNGNLHIEIVLGTFPQRGKIPYTAKLVYDSAIWQPWFNGWEYIWQPTNIPNSQGGWRFVTTADRGDVTPVTSTDIACGTDPIYYYYTDYGPFIWTAPDGTQHSFPIYTERWPSKFCGPGGGPDSGDAFADDSSGYHMYVTNYTRATVYARDGTAVYVLLGGGVKDTNGNYFSLSNGNTVDTLNRTPVTSSVNGNTTTYSVLNSQGGTSNFTVTTTTVNYSTDFQQPWVTEVSGSFAAIQTITLPDSTAYNFTYDSGSSGNFGTLASMQLPTGGTISYTFTTFADAYGSRYRWLHSRTSGGGQWVYTPQVISSCPGGCQQKVTVTQPSGDKQVYTFTLSGGYPWNTQTQYYSGSSTLSKTVVTDRDSYNRPIRVTTTLPGPSGNLSRKVEYTYDGNTASNVAALKEWNVYSGTPPSSPDRETDYAYITDANYLAKDIRNRPISITVKNGAGTQVAQTTYSYDSTALTSVTGITHHDDTNYGVGNTYRGNPTVMNKWVGGTSYVTETKYYDTTGQLVQWTDNNGNSTYYSYADNFYTDNGANPPSTFTPASPTNAYLTQETLPIIGAQTTGYYFNTGKQAVTQDQNGATTYQHYLDSRDRPTLSYTAPIVGANRGWRLTQYTTSTQTDIYSSINDVTPSPSCSSCKHDVLLVDGLGRPVEGQIASDPQGAVKLDKTYDSSSRLAIAYNPYRTPSDPTYGLDTLAYDGQNRVVSTTHIDGNALWRFYGADVSSNGGISSQLCSGGLGYPMLSKDEAGKKKQLWEDGYGRVIEADEPDSSNNLTVATCYSYDTLNNLVSLVQGAQTRSYYYDALSRKTQETLPESGTTYYYYTNSSGQLCSGEPSLVCRKTDARTKTITYVYDGLNRLTSKTYSDSTPTVNYYYDQTSYNGLTITNGKGRRTGMANGSGQTAWSYDPGGRILTEKRTISGVTKTTSYGYNLAGLVASITYPTGNTVTYGYDNSENQSSVVDPGNNINYALNVSYAPNAAITSALHGQVNGGFAGITRTYTYNSRLQPSTMVVSSVNGTVQNLTYSYDLGGGVNNGNVVSITNNLNTGRTQSFTYDFLNWIATAQSQATSGTFCWGQSFGFDRYGNLNTINATKCSAPALSLSINNKNQITNTNFTYDAAGNMTHDGTQAYTWDAENKLKTAAGVTYTYHGDGWRVKSSNGKLFWRGTGCSNPILAETDLNGNNAQESIYLSGRLIARHEGSTVYYFFDDHLGSGRVVTNSTGVTQQESDYFPYGGEIVVTNTVDNRYKFTGKRRDTETGFDYSLYRTYYPSLGRWMSTDPVQGNPGNPQSWNLYPYVQNNPTNLTDRLGDMIGWGLMSRCCTPSTVDFWGLFDLALSTPPGGPIISLPCPMCVDGAWEGLLVSSNWWCNAKCDIVRVLQKLKDEQLLDKCENDCQYKCPPSDPACYDNCIVACVADFQKREQEADKQQEECHKNCGS